MIKKFIGLSLVLGLTLASNALADSGPGCGLGSQIWKRNKGLVPHLLALSTNGTFMNTSAMTSGTSGCDVDSVIKRQHETEVFVAHNLDPLTQEMAQGAGTRLDVLAGLMGCPTSVRGVFGELTQARFETLPINGVDSVPALVEVLRGEVRGNAILASACTPVS